MSCIWFQQSVSLLVQVQPLQVGDPLVLAAARQLATKAALAQAQQQVSICPWVDQWMASAHKLDSTAVGQCLAPDLPFTCSMPSSGLRISDRS